MQFTLTVDPPASTPVRVRFTTSGGDATPRLDYGPVSRTITIPRGASSKTVSVVVKHDALTEGTEHFFVDLSSPTGATIVSGHAVGIILDAP
jgi:chitinase